MENWKYAIIFRRAWGTKTDCDAEADSYADTEADCDTETDTEANSYTDA